MHTPNMYYMAWKEILFGACQGSLPPPYNENPHSIIMNISQGNIRCKGAGFSIRTGVLLNPCPEPLVNLNPLVSENELRRFSKTGLFRSAKAPARAVMIPGLCRAFPKIWGTVRV